MRKKYKLDTIVEFNGNEIEVELRGEYTPYKRGTYEYPPEGDEMELTEVIRRVYKNKLGTFVEYDITDFFNDDQLIKFNDMLYANGEEVIE